MIAWTAHGILKYPDLPKIHSSADSHNIQDASKSISDVHS